MVYDIIRDNDSMGDVSSQVYFRFSCPGCVRGRYSDTLISSILFLMVRLIVISPLVFLEVRYIPSADRPWGLFSLSKISVFSFTFFFFPTAKYCSSLLGMFIDYSSAFV